MRFQNPRTSASLHGALHTPSCSESPGLTHPSLVSSVHAPLLVFPVAPCSARADLVNGCVLFHPASRPRPSALPPPLDPQPAFRLLANGTARVDGRLRARPSPPRIWDYFFRMHSQKQSFWVAVHERFCCLTADLSFHFRLIIPIYKVNSKAWDAAASSPPSAGSAIPERFDFMAGKRPPVGLACVCVRVSWQRGQPSGGAASRGSQAQKRFYSLLLEETDPWREGLPTVGERWAGARAPGFPPPLDQAAPEPGPQESSLARPPPPQEGASLGSPAGFPGDPRPPGTWACRGSGCSLPLGPSWDRYPPSQPPGHRAAVAASMLPLLWGPSGGASDWRSGPFTCRPPGTSLCPLWALDRAPLCLLALF